MIIFRESIIKPKILTLNSPESPDKDFCSKIAAVSLFLLYEPPTSCKVSEKTNEPSLKYPKTDGLTD